MKTSTPKLLGLLFLISLLYCKSNIGKTESSTTLGIKEIIIDTSFGYPYPKNYDWETWVRNGEYSLIPSKSIGSKKPLIELMHKESDELYRINLERIFVTIHNDPSSRLMKIQKDSILTENQNVIWPYPDSVRYIERDTTLSPSDFNTIIKKIRAVQIFNKTTIDSLPRLVDDGYSMEIEGIKDGKYNLIYRICPDKRYESKLYSLGKWLLERI